MTAATIRSPAADLAGVLSRGRRFRNGLATVLMCLAFLVAVVPLTFVLVVIVIKGIKVIGVDWFTKDIPTNIQSAALASKFGAAPEKVIYGMRPAIVGTIQEPPRRIS